MRRLILSLALTIAFSPAAWADAGTVSLTPPGSAGADVVPDAQAAQAMRVLQMLHARLEQAGYRDVQVIPQALVVSAKDHKGNPALLLVDTETLMALQLEPPATGTTGSAPQDQDRR
jgi:hypothetical protein